MTINQFAIYQVNMNTDGRVIKGQTYSYLKEHKIRPTAKYYRQVYMGKLNGDETVYKVKRQIKDAKDDTVLQSVGTSDVIVINQDGLVKCYYIDSDRWHPISGFIPVASDGNVIHLDTKTLQIEDPYEKVNRNMTAVFFMYHGERGELQYNVLRRDIFEKLFIPKKEI